MIESILYTFRRIWEASPLAMVQRAMISDTRQIIGMIAGAQWLFIIALLLPHGMLDASTQAKIYQYEPIYKLFVWSWWLVIADSLAALVLAPAPKTKRLIISVVANCACPCLRVLSIPSAPNYHVWLPCKGWQQRSRALTKAVEITVLPIMMLITLLILPVLAVELLGIINQDEVTLLNWLMHILMSIVWFAFTLEFLLMMAVVQQPVAYVKKHWINLVIILLPIFAFIRALQIVRVASIAKMTRAYRLRGITTRAKNILLLFSVFDRVIPSNPSKKLEKLLQKREELEDELIDLDIQIAIAHEAVHCRDDEKSKKP